MSRTSVRVEVESALPAITFQDTVPARRAIHCNELAQARPAALVRDLIEALAVYQATTMRILYRFDAKGHSFSYEELLDHFYELIQFWLTMLREMQAELLVS